MTSLVLKSSWILKSAKFVIRLTADGIDVSSCRALDDRLCITVNRSPRKRPIETIKSNRSKRLHDTSNRSRAPSGM